MSEGAWRVGNPQSRNIYRGDNYVAVVVGDDYRASQQARLIVDALNYVENRTGLPLDGSPREVRFTS